MSSALGAVTLLYLGAERRVPRAPCRTLSLPRAAEPPWGSLRRRRTRWLTLAVIVSVLGSLAANIIRRRASRGRPRAPSGDSRASSPPRRPLWLVFQAVFAAALTLSGKFAELVATVSFAATFFYALGGAALFVYRRGRPEAPWTTPGYPWVPAFYVTTSLVFTAAIALDAPKDALRGLLILAAGVAVYAWQAWRQPAR